MEQPNYMMHLVWGKIYCHNTVAYEDIGKQRSSGNSMEVLLKRPPWGERASTQQYRCDMFW